VLVICGCRSGVDMVSVDAVKGYEGNMNVSFAFLR
jgi:hypothetical protein